MERIPYLVRLGNRGLSLRYLINWWDGRAEPRPPDLEAGAIRVQTVTGFAWDLTGEEADAFRCLVIDAARSFPGTPKVDLGVVSPEPAVPGVRDGENVELRDDRQAAVVGDLHPGGDSE